MIQLIKSYYIVHKDDLYKVILESNLYEEDLFNDFFVLFLDNNFKISKFSMNRLLDDSFESEIQLIVNKSEIEDLISIIEDLKYIKLE